jgi:hypothetical protein
MDRLTSLANSVWQIFLTLRRPFHLYADEFQSFATESFALTLSEARKYALTLTIGHQYLDQIPDSEPPYSGTSDRSPPAELALPMRPAAVMDAAVDHTGHPDCCTRFDNEIGCYHSSDDEKNPGLHGCIMSNHSG